MFKEIHDFISKGEFSAAVKKLIPIISYKDDKVVAYANYLLGYIYSCSENKEKNDLWAISYLKNNLNSDYPNPYAYVLYSKIEKDENTALNYLYKGIAIFPNECDIYHELFRLTQEKDTLMDTILENGICDFAILKDGLSHILNSTFDWDKTNLIVNIIQKNNVLSDYDTNYLNMLKAYSYLFKKRPEFYLAIDILAKVIEIDIDNNLCYSPYLGIIYAYIKIDKIEDAITYFDKLPLNNSIHDLNDGPWCVIEVQFDKVYEQIFYCIINKLANDSNRKNKAKQLYALYLYSSSEIYNIYRYRRSNIRVLQTSLKKNFNSKIATACYNMLCHYKEYIAANEVLLEFFINYIEPDEDYINIKEITNNISQNDMKCLCENTIDVIIHKENFDTGIYAQTLFKALVERLFEDNLFSLIVSLSECLSDVDILNSGDAFECAYSYSKFKNERGKRLYEQLIDKENDNSAAINNLGNILESKGEFRKAFDCYKKACMILPEKDIYKNNLSRIEEKIRTEKEIEIKNCIKNMNLNYFEKIGYTDELKDKFLKIDNVEYRNILLRDLNECAISVVIGQDKSAIIMCGSLIETLLLCKISLLGLCKYDVSEINHSRNATNFPIMNMGLNELLYVAEKEKIIQVGNYYLGQYIRDYRNIVHPSKEIRIQQNISHENAVTVWTLLKQIINRILV